MVPGKNSEISFFIVLNYVLHPATYGYKNAFNMFIFQNVFKIYISNFYRKLTDSLFVNLNFKIVETIN